MFRHYLIPVLITICCFAFCNPGFAQADSVSIKHKDSEVNSFQHKSTADSIKLSAYNFEDELKKNNPIKFPSKLKPGRLAASLVVEGSLYASSLIWLNSVWYSQYAKSHFHLFNDVGEWEQMDKCGHIMSAYTISNLCYYSYRWSGMKQTPAVLYAGAVGLAYMTTIEVMDGYSSAWGFSIGDMTANLIGTSIFVAQQLAWKREYIRMKMSYHPTIFAKLRPEDLGGNALESIIKDYNGLTFWASLGSSVFVRKSSHFPRWICLSLGYGADGMLGGFSNPTVNSSGQTLPQFDRYRQFYLSFDVDLSVIKTKSKFLKILLLALNDIKIPFPTLEYNTKGQFKFHYLYF